MKMSQTDESIGIVLFHFENFQIDLFGMFEIPHFSIGIGNTGENRHIARIMFEVPFPYLYGVAVLVKCFITVRQSEEGVIIILMSYEALLIKPHRISEFSLLSRSISQTYQGVIIVRIQIEDLSEEYRCIFN